MAVPAGAGAVFAANAALFWAAAVGIALDSEAVVEQAARNRTASTTAGRINLLGAIPGRANQ